MARTKFEQIGKCFIEVKIRLPPSILNLDDGLQEASGFRFPHVVECYEDEDRHVLLIARSRGRTIELRVPRTFSVGGSERTANCYALLRAEGGTLKLASTLRGGVFDAPAVTHRSSIVQSGRSNNIAALLAHTS